MQQYLVVCRAESGIRIGKQDPILLGNFPSPFGQVDISLQTRFAPYRDFSKPLLRGLMAEVRGMAPSLDEALQEFSRLAQSLCPLLTILGNSPIEDMVPELGYDVTLGCNERDFFQQFIPMRPLLIVQRRRVSSALFLNTLRTLVHHKEVQRLRRAIAQYYQALRYWEPGQEVLALAHMWMGVEALTPVVLRRVLREEGRNRSQLAASWDVEERDLGPEVRKRLILRGDAEAYREAKKASDGFEHGFLGFEEIHAASDLVRAKVADHLRHAIVRELELSPEDEETVLSEDYSKPGHLRVNKYARGKLLGAGEELAAADQQYPILMWTTHYVEVSDPSEDGVSFKMQETFTPRLAEGISFNLRRIEVWGGQESAFRKDD